MMEASDRAPSMHSAGSEPEDLASTPLSLARAVLARRREYVQPCKTRVKIGTWNVAACPGTDKDLASWFVGGEGLETSLAGLDLARGDATERVSDSRHGAGQDVGLYVLGLQEVVDLNPTKEYMNLGMYGEASPADKWKAALEAAMPAGYQLVLSEQMTGLLLLIYASPEIAPSISNVSTHQIGTGLLGYFGNKGAVVTRLVLGETTRLVFVNCHLAGGAGASYLDRRCWDVGQILSKTQFGPVVSAGVAEDDGSKIGDEDYAFWFGDLNFRLDGLPGEDIRRLLTLHARGEYDVQSPMPIEGGDGIMVMKGPESDDDTTTTISSMHSREHSFDSTSSLPDPDDFPEDPSQDPASLQSTIDSLLPHDQLRRVIGQRKLFHDGWREGHISFLPTYKYDIGTVGLFDSSEKQRAPSWCDRILYRTRRDKEAYDLKVQGEKESRERDEEMKSRGVEEDDDVLFSYDPETDGEEQPQQPRATDGDYDEYDDEVAETEMEPAVDEANDHILLEAYTSHQRVMSSDHKPVVSVFTLKYQAVDAEKRAVIHAEVAREFDRAENEGRPGVTLVVEGSSSADGAVDFGDMSFLERRSRCVTVANTSGVAASLEFLPRLGTESSEDAGTASWLGVSFHRSDTDDEKDTLGPLVTLEPGETVSAVIVAQVSAIAHLRGLNDGSTKLEDVLILRVDGGRDHFIPVWATWLPSCFGRSMDELIRIPEGGVRKFLADKGIRGAIPYDGDVHCSAPRELFKLTEAIQVLAERCVADAAMLQDMALPRDAGWPFDPATWDVHLTDQQRQALEALVISALDTGGSALDVLPVELPSPHKLQVMSSVLLLFLGSLVDGVVPPGLWAKLGVVLPNLSSLPAVVWADAKNTVLDVLAQSPSHNIAFVFLTATLARVAGELGPLTVEAARPLLSRRISFRPGVGESEGVRRRRARERRYAELVAPLCFRGSGSDHREKDRDRATRDKERVLVEMFLRRDDEEG